MKIAMIILFGLSIIASVRAEDAVDYTKQIKPILQARCYACHGVLKQKGGLRLDSVALAIKGGKHQPVVKPGDAEASLLVWRVSTEEESERMPPEGEPLKPAEIAALRSWIAQGAKAPVGEKPETDPRQHWAFQAPKRPLVPVIKNTKWVINPIDAFIGFEHQKRGLIPQEPADKRLWLRRVSLDLIGLPPTRKELDAFLADGSADATDKVVKRLLDSPQYGERWGRHWMDIWRYSDWWGLGPEVRNSQKHIWHWRDWIIESLNSDKGYDQMLREMLAADELYPNDLDKLRASGLLARQYFKFNRTSWLDETVEHISKAMLGLTFNCAKCHDHKYDPILHEDYYRLRAVFEPYQVRTDAVPGVIDFEVDGIPRAFDSNLEVQTFLHIRGDDRRPDKGRVIQPGLPAFLAISPLKIEPVLLPPEAYQPGLRPFVLDTYLSAADRRLAEARIALENAKQARGEAEKVVEGPDHRLKQDLAKLAVTLAEKTLSAEEAQLASIKTRAVADWARQQQAPLKILATIIAEAARAERSMDVAKADEAAIRAELELLKATPAKKADLEKKLIATKSALETARKAMEKPGDTYSSLIGALKMPESNLETEESRRKPFPKMSTGRRSALAKWMTDPKNPLPARVAVNHLWARHFGKALVPTVFDFGRKGTRPTHPELLDWLAVELIDHGWSMKHIHRLIVTSKTYRLSSSSAHASKPTEVADPDNHFYWRANPTRMEAQIVRDSLLLLAGELNLTQGGPSIPIDNEASRRRSLYYVHSHNEHQKFLSTFDDASVLECYRRAESIVPQQALALENSPLATAMAAKIAQNLTKAQPQATDREFIRDAFLTVLAVEPTDAELQEVLKALARWIDLAKQKSQVDATVHARNQLIQALLNHNDFITVR